MVGVVISIVIPVFNGSRTLKRCLDSVLASEYKTLEVICVDSNSTDNSKQIISAYPDVKYLNSPNKGIAAQRSYGIRRATGDYITSIDCDDFIHPSALSASIQIIERYGCDVVCYPFQNGVPEETSYRNYKFPQYDVFSYKIIKRDCVEYKFLLASMFYTLLFSCCNKVVKRGLAQEALSFYNEQIHYSTYEDTLYATYVINRASILGLFDNPFYFYVDNHSSTSRTKIFTPESLRDMLSNYEGCQAIFPRKIRDICLEQWMAVLTKRFITIGSDAAKLGRIKPIYRTIKYISKGHRIFRVLSFHNIRCMKTMFSAKVSLLLLCWKLRLYMACSLGFLLIMHHKNEKHA